MTQIPRYWTFDGADGVGKTTQLLRFAERLRTLGYNVKVTKELGGDGKDFLQGQIRTLLLHPEFPADDMVSEEMIFSASDLRHLKLNEQFLNESDKNVIVSDRGMASHVSYARAKDASDVDIDDIHHRLFSKYDELGKKFGGVNVLLIPQDERMALDRVIARGAGVVARLENLTMQRNVIQEMRAYELALGDRFPFGPQNSFKNVTLSVGRDQSIEQVDAMICGALHEFFVE